MDVRLPRLGEGADSGTVASILVKEGDQVKKDQPLLELESEKAVATIPSPGAGTVAKLFIREGDQIRVGSLLLSLLEVPSSPALQEPPEAEEQRPPEPTIPPAPPPQKPPGFISGAPPPASPSIRKMARELGIDLTRIQGSERGGRIVLADVRRYLQSLQQLALAAPAGGAPEPARPAAAPVDFAKWGKVDREKMTMLRSTISNRMVAAWTSIPHITQFDEADITGILSLRKKYAARYEKQSAHLTLTAFALKVIAPVLKKFPKFNASLDEMAQEIVYKRYVHVGIAVDTDDGLIVPVLRDVDQKSLRELATELNELAERTRQRKVSLEEMQGGSFTISNQGGIGGGPFTPIVNKPQVAILGMGRGRVKSVIRNGRAAHRTMLPLALSYDHRIIDGADAARFMVETVEAFENFTEADVRL
jgi:pyruvate dehydrogenase E2 component (dihydrolipoamide acetyltransferase)